MENDPILLFAKICETLGLAVLKKDEIRVQCFQSVELQLLSGHPVLFKEQESFKI